MPGTCACLDIAHNAVRLQWTQHQPPELRPPILVPKSVLALLALLQAGRIKFMLTGHVVQAAAPTTVTYQRWRMAQIQGPLRTSAPATQPLLPADAAADRLQLCARSVADVIRLSVSVATVARRHNIFGEFEKFLSRHQRDECDSSGRVPVFGQRVPATARHVAR